ncbi:N-acetylglutamate synthase [Klebsiella oxytoca]|nr:N-acetylglutamate synthase [Klebsiella oxytoca]
MVKERRTELVEGFRHSVPYINAIEVKRLSSCWAGKPSSMIISLA